MRVFWCKVLETENGKTRPLIMLVAAYNRKKALVKIEDYYTVALGNLGISYRVQAVYSAEFNAGDICIVTRKMQA